MNYLGMNYLELPVNYQFASHVSCFTKKYVKRCLSFAAILLTLHPK